MCLEIKSSQFHPYMYYFNFKIDTRFLHIISGDGGCCYRYKHSDENVAVQERIMENKAHFQGF